MPKYMVLVTAIHGFEIDAESPKAAKAEAESHVDAVHIIETKVMIKEGAAA